MIVASFGGGVNSTAMLIGMHERGERVDLILFADTGGEKPHTYEHVLTMTDWLVKRGMPPITTVSREVETLESGECVEAITRAGLPQPGKSSCFFCPNMKKPEIFLLRQQYPDLATRAVAMEKNAELTAVKGLGRSFAWGDLYAADDAQSKLFPESRVPQCDVCYDG